MDRRNFLGVLGAAGVSGSVSAETRDDRDTSREFNSILVDTTRCIGCRTCEVTCAEKNGLPPPDLDDDSVYESPRPTSESQFTVVNYFDTDDQSISTKRQCFHCSQPACAAACLTKAMLKTEEGPVIWREDRCMGCRFCMISCPFDVPKFEYDSAIPRIRKCDMCYDRLKEGLLPACVEACPAEALQFGKRSDMLRLARRRIHDDPGQYYDHIYGEHEAGGTDVLYLASVPFEDIGFNTKVGSTAYPERTKDFLYGVPIVLTMWPAFLLAVSNATKPEPSTSPEREDHADT